MTIPLRQGAAGSIAVLGAILFLLRPPETGVRTSPVAVAGEWSQKSSTPHPNEPPGMTMLSSHDGSALMPDGWFNAVGQISIVDDPQKGKALQLAMQGTTTPGSGTARIDTYPEMGSFGATKVYISFWQKLSPNFKGNNGAGSFKNAILKTQATYNGHPNGGFHLQFCNNAANVDSRIRPCVTLINMTDHDGRRLNPADNPSYTYPDAGEPADPGDLMSRGTWHFIEGVWTANTRGNADGTIKVWIEGVSPAASGASDFWINGLSGTGIKQLYDGMARYTGLELTNVWGGGGTAIPADNWYRYKDIYVSGGYARPGERPDHWNLTVHEGYNPPAGSDVHITAQLVDGNSNPVDICFLKPNLTVTGGATWEYWNGAGVYAAYAGCEHGRQLFTIHTSARPGTRHVVSVEDYATIKNGAKGDRRTGTSQPIITR